MHSLTLSDIAEIIMGQSPKGEDCNNDPSGTPLLNGPTEFGPRFPVAVQFTSDPKRFSKVGDILFCVRGSTTGRMNFADRAYAIGRGIAAIRGKNGYPTEFVKGIIDSSLSSLLVQATGSTFPNVSREMLKNLKIPFVAPETASKIAEILSSLDDKIELNRQMNATLEAMARALFKAWFVDFEPVHANIENRPSTSASPEIAKLFPSDFENGIPKGWDEKRLDQVFEINPLRSLRRGMSAKYLDMASVPTSGHRVSRVINRAFTSGMKFRNGDTLLARITPCLENGKTAFVDFLKDEEVGWGSTEFIVFRPNGGLPEYFAYLLCRTDEFRNFAIRSMTGTSGRQRVQVDSLGKYPLSVPPPASLIGDKFKGLLNPLIVKIKQNSEEMDCLAQIRNSLLPRLISGKLGLKPRDAA